MKLKVCGMKYQENMQEVGELLPDYMGFIFYDRSPRNFDGDISKLPLSIKKTGVFVDTSIDFVIEKVLQYDFKAIQLHGNESPKYCKDLNSKLKDLAKSVELWKVFSIKDKFDFKVLQPFEGIVDYFLFDTKGKEKGGNGYTFNWDALRGYPSSTPFILSGGIGLEEIHKIKEISETDLPIYAIDVNSKFEDKPGQKNIENLKQFKKHLFSD